MRQTTTVHEETYSERFRRRLRKGSSNIIWRALHPRKYADIAPLSCSRLMKIAEHDRRMLAVCADVLAVHRQHTYAPLEGIVDIFLSAYGKGEIASEWEALKEAIRLVEEEIENVTVQVV